MDDIELARFYTAAVNRQEEAEDTQSRLVHDNVLAYDRFFDLASRLSPEKARSQLPKEAAIVDRIEAGSQSVVEARAARWDALDACLIQKMATVSQEPADFSGDGVLPMIDALRKVGRFRVEHLDGVDSKFEMLLEQGVGFQPKDKKRLLNRLISTWARGRGVSLRDLRSKFEEGSRRDHIEPAHSVPMRS